MLLYLIFNNDTQLYTGLSIKSLKCMSYALFFKLLYLIMFTFKDPYDVFSVIMRKRNIEYTMFNT